MMLEMSEDEMFRVQGRGYSAAKTLVPIRRYTNPCTATIPARSLKSAIQAGALLSKESDLPFLAQETVSSSEVEGCYNANSIVNRTCYN